MTLTSFAGRSAPAIFARIAGALLLACAATATWAQVAAQSADAPGRAGRVTHAEGAVTFSGAGSREWTHAQPNWPLTGGDRVRVDRNARSELHLGSSAVRLGAQSTIEITALDDQAVQLNLTQGSLSVRIRELAQGERFEVGTPNLALALNQPGEYRIDVDPAGDTTRVAVHSGVATLYGENRETTTFKSGQQMRFSGRDLAPAAPNAWLQRDAFDQWAAGRDRMEDESVSARYVSRDVIGYQQLDQHGEWHNDPGLGAVWIPRVTVADWAPYRYGRWISVAPWGLTWIDDAPWGFAPSHYGRWTQLGSRWAWVPGPRTQRPVFAPSRGAYAGGHRGGLNRGGPPGQGRDFDNRGRFENRDRFDNRRGFGNRDGFDNQGRFGNRERPVPPRAGPLPAGPNPQAPAAAAPPPRLEQQRQEQRRLDQVQRQQGWMERGQAGEQRARPGYVQPASPQMRQQPPMRTEQPMRREPQARPRLQDHPERVQQQPRADGPGRERPGNRPERQGRHERGQNRQ